jgi:6,7-dimethyl-8-ribityllumazine synthase
MGILRAGLDNHKPVTFGVLTTDNPEQAFQRAGGHVGNKGADAANAAMDMIETLQQIRSAGSPL